MMGHILLEIATGSPEGKIVKIGENLSLKTQECLMSGRHSLRRQIEDYGEGSNYLKRKERLRLA